jgi:hypothetical protein
VHSATAFGLPFMLLAQAVAAFASLFTPADRVIWLPAERGVNEALWLAARRFGSAFALYTFVIWFPAARGESRASLALMLMVIAANATAPMIVSKFDVFIIFLSG